MRAAALAVVPLLIGLASAARADIVVVTGANNTGTQFVTFADQAASATVFGSAGGGTDNFSVTGTTVSPGNLVLATGGEVQGSGSDLTSLTLAQTDGTPFTQLVINIDAATSGSVMLTVLQPTFPMFQDDFVVDANGQNFFTISALNGQSILSVTVTGLLGTTISALDSARFGPVAASGVPEPATWAMMLLGFGAVGLSMRRRRRAAALA